KTELNMTYNHLGVELNTINTNFFDVRRAGSRDLLFEVTNYYKPSEKLNVLFGGTAYKQRGHLINLLDRYDNSWFSAYSQVDYRIIDEVKLIVGAQYNNIEGVGSDLVPRAGLIYNATDNIGAKVLWGQSFRAPYAFETKGDTLGLQIGNPNLSPEKLTNLDLQLLTSEKSLFDFELP
ncbi:MAG: TonB-dependent receptor, partial [Bacteroidota bacterium]